MPRIGITGHVHLTPESGPLVYDAIRVALAGEAARAGRVKRGVDAVCAALGFRRPFGLTGISCIARGADALFAEAVLELGGRLEVIVPAADYRSHLDPGYARTFDALIERAAKVRVLTFDRSGRDAYEAANHALVHSRLYRLYAVWDGTGHRLRGDTASAVEYARANGVRVELIWPSGAARCQVPQPEHRTPEPGD